MELTLDDLKNLTLEASQSAVRIALLEKQLTEQEDMMAGLRQRCEQAEQRVAQLEEECSTLRQAKTTMELENDWLRHYLLLSWKKIEAFLKHVNDLQLLSFLQVFMTKTVDDRLGSERALAMINEAVKFPEQEPQHVILDEPEPEPLPTDEQMAQALRAINGRELRQYQQWLGVCCLLSWKYGYARDLKECCDQIAKLPTGDLPTPCRYDNIRKYGYMAFVKEDARLWPNYHPREEERRLFNECLLVSQALERELRGPLQTSPDWGRLAARGVGGGYSRTSLPPYLRTSGNNP